MDAFPFSSQAPLRVCSSHLDLQHKQAAQVTPRTTTRTHTARLERPSEGNLRLPHCGGLRAEPSTIQILNGNFRKSTQLHCNWLSAPTSTRLHFPPRYRRPHLHTQLCLVENNTKTGWKTSFKQVKQPSVQPVPKKLTSRKKPKT